MFPVGWRALWEQNPLADGWVGFILRESLVGWGSFPLCWLPAFPHRAFDDSWTLIIQVTRCLLLFPITISHQWWLGLRLQGIWVQGKSRLKRDIWFSNIHERSRHIYSFLKKKVFINFVLILCFCFMFCFFGCKTCRIIVPWPGKNGDKKLPASEGSGFDSWSEKIPDAMEQLCPRATATEPTL